MKVKLLRELLVNSADVQATPAGTTVPDMDDARARELAKRDPPLVEILGDAGDDASGKSDVAATTDSGTGAAASGAGASTEGRPVMAPQPGPKGDIGTVSRAKHAK